MGGLRAEGALHLNSSCSQAGRKGEGQQLPRGYVPPGTILSPTISTQAAGLCGFDGEGAMHAEGPVKENSVWKGPLDSDI